MFQKRHREAARNIILCGPESYILKTDADFARMIYAARGAGRSEADSCDGQFGLPLCYRPGGLETTARAALILRSCLSDGLFIT